MDYLPSSFSIEQEELTADSVDLQKIDKLMSISNSAFAEGISATAMHEVKARNQAPWSAILSFSALSGDGGGTAFFVSPRVLITAGHCLYTNEGWIDEAQIKINQNEEIKSSLFRVTVGWAGHRDYDYDVGAIILDHPIPTNGYFGLCVLKNSIVDSSLVHCAGFPFLKEPTSKDQPRPFVHAAGKVASTERAIKYGFYRGVGSSGTPLWVRTAAGHRLVTAIHTRQPPKEDESNRDIRYAVRLTGELVRCIKSWIDEAESIDAAARPSPTLRAIDS
jgi:V8-like Glu-specific endopeptidase